MNDKPNSPMELLLSVSGITLAMLGFTIRWSEIPWAHQELPVLFVPLFLASVYSVLRWFQLDLSRSFAGRSPAFWWIASGLVLAFVVEPSSSHAKGRFLFCMAALIGVIWWAKREFARAEAKLLADGQTKRT